MTQKMVLLEEEEGVSTLEKHFGGKLHKFHFVTLFMNNNSIHGSIGVQDYMVRGREQKRRGEERVEIQIGVEKLDEGIGVSVGWGGEAIRTIHVTKVAKQNVRVPIGLWGVLALLWLIEAEGCTAVHEEDNFLETTVRQRHTTNVAKEMEWMR